MGSLCFKDHKKSYGRSIDTFFGPWHPEVKILILINLAIYTVHEYSLTVSYTLCSSMLSCSPSSLTVWRWRYSLRFREMTQMKSTKHW